MDAAVEPSRGSAPPRGSLRITGHVLVGEKEPLPPTDAVVRVYRGIPSEQGSRFLDAVRVRDGAFAYDLAADVVKRSSALGPSVGTIGLVLFAPGYDNDSESFELEDAVDGVLRVTLRTQAAGVLVLGRVVDVRGAPIGGAQITMVDFGPLGERVEICDRICDDAGHFQVSLTRRGFVDVVVRHPAHGVGQKFGARQARLARLDGEGRAAGGLLRARIRRGGLCG